MNTVNKYGLITGLVWADLPFIVYYTGGDAVQKNIMANVVGMLVFAFFITLGIWQRKKELEGDLDMREGLKRGLGIAIIAAVINAFGTFIFYRFVNNKLTPELTESLRKSILSREPGLAPEQLLEKIHTYMSNMPFARTTAGVALLIFLGGLVTFVSTGILRKRQRSL